MRRWLINPAVILGFLVGGCTNIEVRTDFDRTVDFSRFKTFAFTGFTDINQEGILDNSLTRKRLETLIAGELTKKGLTGVAIDQTPDLLVHYWMGVEEKQKLDDMGTIGMYRGYRGYAGGAGYGGVRSRDYKEGTLITDLIDPVTKTLLWRATMVTNLRDTTEENIALGTKAIRKAFENYPPAGGKP
ncbi:MAG TPA: DUF4136 domain-containing protein [Nitrospira sp.]|nr:DUF4136 domain-containing protein [Nitrospira sp.]